MEFLATVTQMETNLTIEEKEERASLVEETRFIVTNHNLPLLPAISKLNPNLGSTTQLQARNQLLKSLTSLEQFSRFANSQIQLALRDRNKLLFDLTKDSAELRALLSEHISTLSTDLEQARTVTRKKRIKTALAFGEAVGIGEVVIVSPEGPHAIAGGLAQVTVGLLKSLAAIDLPVSLISPLYDAQQGNKHKSAAEILKNGFYFLGKQLELTKLCDLELQLGPTLRWNSTELASAPITPTAQIYQANSGNIRMYFIHHPRFTETLYPDIWSDELLKRSIFFSRATLELLSTNTQRLNPDIIISNDWFTGLVPILLQTDPRYSENPRFAQTKTIHMLHNCGRDYQGRFPLKHFDQDLFPLFGIGKEHFWGVQDPLDPHSINLTAGAIFHARSGLLTVSQPYAAQLLTAEGGEGLQDLLSKRKDIFYGISNGVDRENLHQIFWESSHSTTNESTNYTEKIYTRRIFSLKENAKTIIQNRYQLTESKDAILVSLVSRLTEQKGIQLLLERIKIAPTTELSVLEAMLQLQPDVQLFIGGPLSTSELIAARFKDHLIDLSKRYPGRVATAFQFVPHQEALEICFGSDIVLMPSRFEPGGISQLEALAAGSLVVARNVGGIKATIHDCNPDLSAGNGFLFDEFTAHSLFSNLKRAILIAAQPKLRKRIARRAVLAEHDWTHRIPRYRALFLAVSGVLKKDVFYEHLRPYLYLLESMKPDSPRS
jgi:starch synthase